MLYLAAAAGAENGAERLRPERRAKRQLYEIADNIFLFDGRNADSRALLRQGAKAKNDDAAATADGLSVSEKIVKPNLNYGPDGEPGAGISRYVFGRQAF